jgi:hypothetical protein
MGSKIRAVLWLLLFVFAAFDLHMWGGLAVTPVVGKALREQATVRSPIAATYLYAGRKTVDSLGRAEAAMAFAARHVRAGVLADPGPPEAVVQRVLAAQSATSSLCYYGAPILLVLSLALHFGRQKPIRSLGARG